MELSNPRFPHWCRIIRKNTEDPMEEEEDFNPLTSDTDMSDDDYDPMAEDNAIDDETGSSEDTDTSSSDGGSDKRYVVVYEGECRSFEKNTTSDKGDVITSYRGLALPLNQDGWDKLGIAPQEGDEVVVSHGVFTEYGRVIDKNVATASFAGTHIVWKYGRN